jgi:hypothetical protein
MTTTTTETTTTTATRSTSPSTEHPSFPHAFKSRYYVERGDGWDATVKVDYDGRDGLSDDDVRRARVLNARVEEARTRASEARAELDRLVAERNRLFGGRNPISVATMAEARVLLDQLGLAVGRVDVRATTKGHHLRAWLRWASGSTRPVPASTVLRLHAALGDDPMRQEFNERRVRREEPGWNVLWREKHRNGVVVMREEPDEAWTARARAALGGDRERKATT